MRWLDATLLFGLLVMPAAGCSNTPSTSPGDLPPSSQPPPTKFEAGANCATDNDCEPGLSCLFPITACNALAVCVTPPPSPCDHPQVACSCLAEVVPVCDGYATNQVDPTGTCDGGTTIVPTEAGTDATVSPADAGPDALADAAPASDTGASDTGPSDAAGAGD